MSAGTHPLKDLPDRARILVRGVNWLGDAVMSTPALMRLREAYPDGRITVMTAGKLAELYQAHPAVDNVVTFHRADSLWAIGRRLRQGRYDLGLIFPNSPRSALELWLGRVPRRLGFARPFRNLFLTARVPVPADAVPMRKRSTNEVRALVAHPPGTQGFSPPPQAHHIHHYLHLVAAVGASPKPLAPFLNVTQTELKSAQTRFGLDDSVWFGLNPGAEYGPAKRWPLDRFAAVAVAAQKRWSCRWLILGGAGDRGTAEEISDAMKSGLENLNARPPLILAGRTSLRELCAVLKLCRVVLTNDTGPMHLAAAVGTPVVVPFGSTSPELTGPGLPGDPRHGLVRGEAPCAPCFRRTCPIDFRCLRGIGPEAVIDELARVLDDWPAHSTDSP
jgi:heptosyltransferase-2